MAIYVVDVNVLESGLIGSTIDTDPHAKFVIADAAIVEMCKNQHWLTTMKLALRAFDGHQSRVLAAPSVGELLSTEARLALPLTPDQVISQPYTDFVRKLITDLASSRADNDIDLQKHIENARARLNTADLDAELAKSRTSRYVEILKNRLPEKILKTIRSRRVEMTDLLALAHMMTHFIAPKSLQTDYRLSSDDATELSDSASSNFRFDYLMVRHALLALRDGGDISTMKPTTELNHQFDQHYVLIASHFGRILSNDRRVNEAYGDLRSMLATDLQASADLMQAWFVSEGIAPE
ncbi:hypothetical protein AB4Y42_37330 [Paraburkholderia sp. EG286B]|uniref:hypothetical protein n=1 Tax=Paraburkholderia sp. EG286B TaxID=3237011 RepID=UPI0034D2E814